MVAHPQGVGVREGHAERPEHLAMVLADAVQFAPEILRGHLDVGQHARGHVLFEGSIQHGRRLRDLGDNRPILHPQPAGWVVRRGLRRVLEGAEAPKDGESSLRGPVARGFALDSGDQSPTPATRPWIVTCDEPGPPGSGGLVSLGPGERGGANYGEGTTGSRAETGPYADSPGAKNLHRYPILSTICSEPLSADVYNLVRLVMIEASRRQGVDVERISFIDAMRWLVEARPGDDLAELVVNPDRPGRCEPRVRKRRPKAYPLMTKPRSVLRKALLAQQVGA